MYIICPLPYIPLRDQPSHKAEQTSQLLFGETAIVLDTKNNWYNIKCDYDNYEGWIEKKTVVHNNNDSDSKTIKGFARLVNVNGSGMWLSTGCEISSNLINSQQSTIITINPELNEQSIAELSLQFLGTPYLWGGRSFMGIDCSGFVQVVYKAVDIKMPRDASQQVDKGEVVQFTSEAKAGDLAFFDNEEGIITHVGIVLGGGKIIHAAGAVRIDQLDQQGIYNQDLGSYTHKLRIIKRVIF